MTESPDAAVLRKVVGHDIITDTHGGFDTEVSEAAVLFCAKHEVRAYADSFQRRSQHIPNKAYQERHN